MVRLSLLPIIALSLLSSTYIYLQSSAGNDALSSYSLIEEPGMELEANQARIDEDGWMHFIDVDHNALLLSIQTFGQNIGQLNDGLEVTSGLLGNYGHAANDLSGADYIDKSIWFTINRYWRIESRRKIAHPVKVRFYYTRQDFLDIQQGISGLGYTLLDPENMWFYVLEGANVHPFALHARANQANVVIYNKTSSIKFGTFKDYFYAEFTIDHINAAGSAGIQIQRQSEGLSVEGKVFDPFGNPVPGVFINSPLGDAAVCSTEEGLYKLTHLTEGKNYEIRPFVKYKPAEGVTVLDLIGLDRHLSKQRKIDNPYILFAADADQSMNVDRADLKFMRSLILGDAVTFPEQNYWRFFPKDYKFSLPDYPFVPRPPQVIVLEDLNNSVSGQDFIGVKCGDIWKEEDFPNEPPSYLDPSFSMADFQSCTGQEIKVGLQVTNFKDIQGFQFTISWDPKVLEFRKVRDFNLPDFDATCVRVKDAGKGYITFAWYATSSAPEIRPKDGTSICKLQFRVIGGDNAFTTLNFKKEPTPIQVIRGNLSPANVLFTLGSVRVNNQSPIYISALDKRDPECHGDANGAIKVEVLGGSPPYYYEWSTGATTEKIENLPEGEYSVTISDGDNCPFVSGPITIKSPQILYLEQKDIRPPLCNGSKNAAISMRVKGGHPPYRYAWSNGATSSWIAQIGPGTYTVTITDSKGCSIEETFEVPDAGSVHIRYSMTNESAPGKLDGAIKILDIPGATEPVRYEWDDLGKKGPRVTHLRSTLYFVNAIDANNCVYPFPINVGLGEPPSEMVISLPKDKIEPNVWTYLEVSCPEEQSVTFKMFDQNSQLVDQRTYELLRGTAHMEFRTPPQPGKYLIQVLPSNGVVRSLRFDVVAQ